MIQYSTPVRFSRHCQKRGTPVNICVHGVVLEYSSIGSPVGQLRGYGLRVLGRRDSPTRFSRYSAVLKQSCGPASPLFLLFIAHMACVANPASQLRALASALFTVCTHVLLPLNDFTFWAILHQKNKA